MGFVADFKAKRADKRATQEFDYLHYTWQEDIAQLEKLIKVFTAAADGEDSVPNLVLPSSVKAIN